MVPEAILVCEGSIPAMDEALPLGHRQLRPTAGATQDFSKGNGDDLEGNSMEEHAILGYSLVI